MNTVYSIQLDPASTVSLPARRSETKSIASSSTGLPGETSPPGTRVRDTEMASLAGREPNPGAGGLAPPGPRRRPGGRHGSGVQRTRPRCDRDAGDRRHPLQPRRPGAGAFGRHPRRSAGRAGSHRPRARRHPRGPRSVHRSRRTVAPHSAPGLPQPASSLHDLQPLAGPPPLHAGLPAPRRPGEPLDPAPRPDHRGIEAERPGNRQPPLQPPLATRHRGAGRMDR